MFINFKWHNDEVSAHKKKRVDLLMVLKIYVNLSLDNPHMLYFSCSFQNNSFSISFFFGQK